MVRGFGVHIPKPAICRICAAARGWNLRSGRPSVGLQIRAGYFSSVGSIFFCQSKAGRSRWIGETLGES